MMKPVLTAAARQAARDHAIEEAHYSSMIYDAQTRLSAAGWKNIDVKRKGMFVAISADDPAGANHSAALEDGPAITDFLISIGVPPERKTTDAELEQERNAHPEIFSGTDTAPAAEPVGEPEPVAEEGEPLPDTLARLVPDTIEQQARKKWLHDRWLELSHKVHAPKVFGVTTAEIREHEELERYRGLFT